MIKQPSIILQQRTSRQLRGKTEEKIREMSEQQIQLQKAERISTNQRLCPLTKVSHTPIVALSFQIT